VIGIRVERDECALTGQCVTVAPALFWFDDEGELHHRESVDESEREDAERAARLCPMLAIKTDG
jgi:ferredoxin